MEYCKCLKCKKELFKLDIDDKFKKEGCPYCQNKYHFEFKMDVDEAEMELHWITSQCPNCKLIRVVDVLNWEEIKVKFIKGGRIKTKQELISKMNKEEDWTCYCDNLNDDNRERERERQKNWEITQTNCQVRGYN